MKLPSPFVIDSGFNLHPSTNTLSPTANGSLVSVDANPVFIGILNCASNSNSTVTDVPEWVMASMS